MPLQAYMFAMAVIGLDVRKGHTYDNDAANGRVVQCQLDPLLPFVVEIFTKLAHPG